MSTILPSTGLYFSQVARLAAEKLYKDEKTADVYFVFKSGERVPAHKNLLAAGSEVFDAMFYGPIKEKGNVKMDDASAAGFVEFLQFFYSSTIRLTMANIGDVMNLGNKYDVADCVNLCVRFLIENLTVDNVLQIIDIAILFEHNELQSKCERMIRSNTENVLKSLSFLECDRQALDYILKLDRLSCRETVVFKAMMSWAKAVSKKEELTKDIIQTHLGDFFYQIRFRSMTYDEFVDLMPSFGNLFAANEFIEILQMIKNESFQSNMFNGSRRITKLSMWNDEAIIECDQYVGVISGEPYRIRNVETTTFTTNKPFLLGYFKFGNICKYVDGTYYLMAQPLSADVTIAAISNGIKSEVTVLHTWKVELLGLGSKIKLPEPIFIDPIFKYELRLNINVSEDFVTRWKLKSEVQIDDIAVIFHNDSLVNGEQRNLVHALGLNRVNE